MIEENGGDSMSNFALEMKGITKEFPGVKALDKVTFAVKKGEIHALCGENGAGKSTLMKVLSGVYPTGSYEGDILIDGRKIDFKNIKESQDAGISIIYQELALVEELSIAENLFLGHDFMRKPIINWNEIYKQSFFVLKKVGLDLDPQTKTSELTVGKQQLVEIAKAFTKKTDILILDEPTAALTESDVTILVKLLNELRDQGVTCIYISHKLGEVMEIADSVTILRDGQTISTEMIKDMTEEKIITKMVGRKLTELFPYEPREIGNENLLEVTNYSAYDKSGKPIVSNINFNLKKGEIVGFSGLMGAGRSELFISLFGALNGKSEGVVKINGNPVTIKQPLDAIKVGLAYVSEDRKRYGLILGMDIIKNSTLIALNKVTKLNIINQALEVKNANDITQMMKLKAPNLDIEVGKLSGGNQQKVVLSKWIMNNPKILILDEPTRGIDVGAKYEIYKIMNVLLKQGVGIILISSELPEILGMSDRVFVMSQGKITGEYMRDEVTQEKVMTSATGGARHV